MKIKRKYLIWILILVVGIAFLWTILTIWVERPGPAESWHFGKHTNSGKVLVIFDPDPIYNLDQQICIEIGKSLAESGRDVTVSTVANVDTSRHYDLYILCANTYNWMPDWAMSDLIQSTKLIHGKNVIDITLGSGSTGHAQKSFQNLITQEGGKILGSQTWWLMKPNDESRLKDPNVQVAISQARELAKQWAGWTENK